MTQVLTKEDIARLHAYLVVPVAARDVLGSGMPMEGDTQYALHVALSEIDPDSALLAIALSAQMIAADLVGEIPVAAALKLESYKIIEEYAPDWLSNYHNGPVRGEGLLEVLNHIPEDLESLADLLESVQAGLRDEDHPAFTLCAVLAIQARAHMEIADFILSELERELDLEATGDNICHFAKADMLEAPEDNIILFPMHRRR